MFLKKRMTKGKIYWSLAESYRKDGKPTQKIILNLGNTEKACELLKASGEYEPFLSQIYKHMNTNQDMCCQSIDEPVVYTVYEGCNSAMIKDVVRLYFQEGSKIADVTWGKGVFWKEIDKKKYNIVGSDIKMGIDFRKLPYENDSFDHSVIDPPYARIEGLKGMVDCYNTTRYITHEDIVNLYRDGLKELVRITKSKGYILCKCQDEIYGGRQYWTHEEIKHIAEKELGLIAEDLFIFINKTKPKPIHKQKHGRKIHSYLWVFQVK